MNLVKFNIGPRFLHQTGGSANQTESFKFFYTHPCCHSNKNC